MLMAGAAHAYNYGRWMCSDCELQPIGTPTSGMDIGSVTAFIRAEDKAIIDSGPTAKWPEPRWIPKDTITVCDGNLCLTVEYQAIGFWLPLGGTYKDNGRSYKNVKASLISGVVGGAGSDFLLAFRTIDYFGTTSYQYQRVITIKVTPPVPRSSAAPFGEGFSFGFEWSGGINSDNWAAQGGHCRINGTCIAEY